MKTNTFRIRKEVIAELTHISENSTVPLSELINTALHEWLSGYSSIDTRRKYAGLPPRHQKLEDHQAFEKEN